MSAPKKVSTKSEWSQAARITQSDYKKMYEQSISDPEAFWADQAKRLDWFENFTRVKNISFGDDLNIRWFEGGKLNVCYNCVDRHLKTKAEKTALIWEPDEPDEDAQHISFSALYEEVCKWGNGLKEIGVRKGDRVTIYMPMVPEAVYAMLACARIGAVHSVVFGGFSPDSIADRIEDCESAFVITADEARRGGKKIPLKKNVDAALEKTDRVKKVLVVQNTGVKLDYAEDRDILWDDLQGSLNTNCPPEPMDAEDPLFILYTSGSTNKPKGVLHTTGGYLVYASLTHEAVFDLREEDVFWCTADVGWITGHSYLVYGPLCNAATSLVFEGVPTYPSPSRFWEVVDRHKVSLFYTAPTAIRALIVQGDEYVKKTSRKSLRILGTVGEPINPEAWNWYYKVVGEERCPVVDTYWQTETGGIIISSLPGATDLKPGSATKPFFGIQPAVVDKEGKTLEGEAEGNLVILDSWPGQMRTVYKDHERFRQTYFSHFPGKYFTGDGCKRDKDGDYWITGRVDDVLNISGHRIGTAEVESAFVAHDKVGEAAVVGCPHSIKGQAIYAYVTLKSGENPSEELRTELVQFVRKEIGAFAQPDFIQWAPSLPKTRSGKIMRRILRKIAENQAESLGDTSTLADPGIVEKLIEERLNR